MFILGHFLHTWALVFFHKKALRLSEVDASSWKMAYVLCSGKAKGTMGMAPTVSEPNTDKNSFNTFCVIVVYGKKKDSNGYYHPKKMENGIFQES